MSLYMEKFDSDARGILRTNSFLPDAGPETHRHSETVSRSMVVKLGMLLNCISKSNIING